MAADPSRVRKARTPEQKAAKAVRVAAEKKADDEQERMILAEDASRKRPAAGDVEVEEEVGDEEEAIVRVRRVKIARRSGGRGTAVVPAGSGPDDKEVLYDWEVLFRSRRAEVDMDEWWDSEETRNTLLKLPSGLRSFDSFIRRLYPEFEPIEGIGRDRRQTVSAYPYGRMAEGEEAGETPGRAFIFAPHRAYGTPAAGWGRTRLEYKERSKGIGSNVYQISEFAPTLAAASSSDLLIGNGHVFGAHISDWLEVKETAALWTTLSVRGTPELLPYTQYEREQRKLKQSKFVRTPIATTPSGEALDATAVMVLSVPMTQSEDFDLGVLAQAAQEEEEEKAETARESAIAAAAALAAAAVTADEVEAAEVAMALAQAPPPIEDEQTKQARLKDKVVQEIPEFAYNLRVFYELDPSLEWEQTPESDRSLPRWAPKGRSRPVGVIPTKDWIWSYIEHHFPGCGPPLHVDSRTGEAQSFTGGGVVVCQLPRGNDEVPLRWIFLNGHGRYPRGLYQQMKHWNQDPGEDNKEEATERATAVVLSERITGRQMLFTRVSKLILGYKHGPTEATRMVRPSLDMNCEDRDQSFFWGRRYSTDTPLAIRGTVRMTPRGNRSSSIFVMLSAANEFRINSADSHHRQAPIKEEGFSPEGIDWFPSLTSPEQTRVMFEDGKLSVARQSDMESDEHLEQTVPLQSSSWPPLPPRAIASSSSSSSHRKEEKGLLYEDPLEGGRMPRPILPGMNPYAISDLVFELVSDEPEPVIQDAEVLGNLSTTVNTSEKLAAVVGIAETVARNQQRLATLGENVTKGDIILMAWKRNGDLRRVHTPGAAERSFTVASPESDLRDTLVAQVEITATRAMVRRRRRQAHYSLDVTTNLWQRMMDARGVLSLLVTFGTYKDQLVPLRALLREVQKDCIAHVQRLEREDSKTPAGFKSRYYRILSREMQTVVAQWDDDALEIEASRVGAGPVGVYVRPRGAGRPGVVISEVAYTPLPEVGPEWPERRLRGMYADKPVWSPPRFGSEDELAQYRVDYAYNMKQFAEGVERLRRYFSASDPLYGSPTDEALYIKEKREMAYQKHIQASKDEVKRIAREKFRQHQKRLTERLSVLPPSPKGWITDDNLTMRWLLTTALAAIGSGERPPVSYYERFCDPLPEGKATLESDPALARSALQCLLAAEAMAVSHQTSTLMIVWLNLQSDIVPTVLTEDVKEWKQKRKKKVEKKETKEEKKEEEAKEEPMTVEGNIIAMYAVHMSYDLSVREIWIIVDEIATALNAIVASAPAAAATPALTRRIANANRRRRSRALQRLSGTSTETPIDLTESGAPAAPIVIEDDDDDAALHNLEPPLAPEI
jgi:hypothetical protein